MADTVTDNDNLILGAIFNPEAPLAGRDEVSHPENEIHDVDPFQGKCSISV